MRDPDRIDEYLDRLKWIWRCNPDLRFNQLVLNVLQNPSDYYMEDEDSIEKFESFYFRSVE